jgi:integrase
LQQITTRALKIQYGSIPASRYVFIGKSGGKIISMRKAFATAVEAAAIMRNGQPIPITPHVLRKAYATWAATEFCVPQAVLQAQLGHAQGSDVTNKYYVRVSDEARKRAVISLPLQSSIA